MSEVDFSDIPYFGDAHCSVYDVEDFDAFRGDAVDNQMRIDDHVSVNTVFGGDMAARRIRQVTFMERQQCVIYLLQVSLPEGSQN